MQNAEKKNYYRLIPMNIERYNIDDLMNEQAHGDLIEWKNGGNDGKNSQKFNKGDIVYIYCHNLSDGSNRILFKGIVDSYDGEGEFSYDSDKKIKSIWIKKVKAFKLNDKDKYSKETLLNKYDLVINQTKQKLCSFDDYKSYLNDQKSIKMDLYGESDKKSLGKYIKHISLVRDLENDTSDASKMFSLKETRDFFNSNILCECCKLLEFSSKEAHARTFKKTNGFTYYEVHHLLMQNILSIKNEDWFIENKWYQKDNDDDKQMILSDFNKINLCPVCHREFHYGDFKYNTNNGIKNKEQLIEKLMELHDFNNNLKKCGKSSSEINDIRKYIISQYRVECDE